MGSDIELAIGIVGAVICLVGFIRVSTGAWGGQSVVYELDNLVGSGLPAWYSHTKGAYSSLVLNVIWAGTALYGLEGSYFRRRQERRAA